MNDLPRPATTVPLATFLDERVEEFARFFLGDLLGHGEFRCVYELASDPETYVVKIETNRWERKFCNIVEFNLWDELREHEDAARWLAPCKWISQNGNFLVQRRVKPLASIEELPELVPSFLADTHWGNFGWLEGRVVCLDYGFHNLLTIPKKLRMVKNSRKPRPSDKA